jgi:hypothetical protein
MDERKLYLLIEFHKLPSTSDKLLENFRELDEVIGRNDGFPIPLRYGRQKGPKDSYIKQPDHILSPNEFEVLRHYQVGHAVVSARGDLQMRSLEVRVTEAVDPSTPIMDGIGFKNLSGIMRRYARMGPSSTLVDQLKKMYGTPASLVGLYSDGQIAFTRHK